MGVTSVPWVDFSKLNLPVLMKRTTRGGCELNLTLGILAGVLAWGKKTKNKET